MPKREDEYWQGDTGGQAYCPVHKHYYNQEFGCQLCYLEKNQKPSAKPEEVVTLIKCPQCNKVSLWWNTFSEEHECLNGDCKQKFTKELRLIETRRILITEIIDFAPKNQDDNSAAR